MALTSVMGSFSLVNFAPKYSIYVSYFPTFVGLLLLQVFITATWSVVVYPKLFSPLRHLPKAPQKGGSFFNGQFKRISNEPSGIPHIDWINNVPNDGLIYYTSIMNQERILITSPQALSEVLTLKSYEFIKPKMLRNGLGRILGVGLVLAEGDEHKAQRKSLMPAFAYRHVKDLYPVFWSKSVKLVNALMSVARKEGKESVTDINDAPVVEIAGWSSRAALDIIGEAGMGHDFNAIDDPDTELNATYRKVFQPTRSGQILAMMGLFLPQWLIRALPVSHNNNIGEASETIKKVCRQLIRQKQEKLDRKEKRTEVDIISVAIESGEFTEEGLVNQMMTFMAAGHETTATAMTWAIYLLCQNPTIQTRLRAEVSANLPPIDSGTPLTFDILDKCHYLHAVCNEVLRLYSPVPLTIREAVHPTTILGQYIPAGTNIILSSWAVNNSTALWGADVGTFNPDRWMGPGRANTGGAESNYSFLTFLQGPRSCIGQAFAKAEFASLLGALVGRFEWELNDKNVEIVIKGGITAKPRGGMHVRMKPLEGW